jgi:hypothetical protein
VRTEGRRNGQTYEVVEGDRVILSYSLHEALADVKLAEAIKRNGWQPILAEGEVIQ